MVPDFVEAADATVQPHQFVDRLPQSGLETATCTPNHAQAEPVLVPCGTQAARCSPGQALLSSAVGGCAIAVTAVLKS